MYNVQPRKKRTLCTVYTHTYSTSTSLFTLDSHKSLHPFPLYPFTPSPPHCPTTSLSHRLTASPHHCHTTSLPHCLTAPPHHCPTTSLPHHITASPPHRLTTSLPHHITASPPHCPTTSLPHHITASPPHPFTLLPLQKERKRVG
jgi:hypothetical protein